MSAQIVGLCIITGACGDVIEGRKARKWTMIIGIPPVLTLAVYSLTDRTKFDGYLSVDAPLSNWGAGSFGTVDFAELSGPSRQLWFYVVRLFLSVSINISSILLVLIDAVCLEASSPEKS
ncbi:unnamed protein product [Hapterophycus canaliculatus]